MNQLKICSLNNDQIHSHVYFDFSHDEFMKNYIKNNSITVRMFCYIRVRM